MTVALVTDKVSMMDLSNILEEGECIIDIIKGENFPRIIITNKKMYKMVLGNGIIVETGERSVASNQVVEVFNFSVDHPIFQSTYKVVQHNNKQELKILSYAIMEEFNSILNIYNYLYDNWEKINISFSTNRSEYESLSKMLPQVPFLKEYFDAFFTETKDIISYLLTLFKIYYTHNNKKYEKSGVKDCIDFIKDNDLTNLKDIFEKLRDVSTLVLGARNAIVHPENHKKNKFLLYNVYLNSDNVLMPPCFEYKSKYGSGEYNVLEYIDFVYKSLLDISKQFLITLV